MAAASSMGVSASTLLSSAAARSALGRSVSLAAQDLARGGPVCHAADFAQGFAPNAQVDGDL